VARQHKQPQAPQQEPQKAERAQPQHPLSARVDALASRLEAALQSHRLGASVGAALKGADKVLGSMDVVAISDAMDALESKVGEGMDAASAQAARAAARRCRHGQERGAWTQGWLPFPAHNESAWNEGRPPRVASAR
jgi:hypothetical protein